MTQISLFYHPHDPARFIPLCIIPFGSPPRPARFWRPTANWPPPSASRPKAFLAPLSPEIIRHAIYELVNKKIQPLLIIDEASLLRLDGFAELHTLGQFQADSKPHLPVILAGQNNLLDLLQYRSSLPLATRIVARSHLEGIDLEQMQLYLAHHLSIAGVKTQLFSPPAVTAIQQGSAGLLH